ncbi:MAG: AbrB family transcriptional regulator [Acidobacteria bacterium]|nr:AbrB family transcriptional regulator [Acidobacteriota bacterium]
MAKITTARVFMSGRSQHVTIPAAYRFNTKTVEVRPGPNPGEIILSPGSLPKPDWEKIWAMLDAANFPDDFLEDRDMRLPQERDLF